MVVVIADDEKMARISLKMMLEELVLPKLKLIECNNGEDLLKELEKSRPDLAFVDIHMPLLNGLEAIEKAKEISPDTVYTIVTGFQEFEFARKAIELKVDNYLLKPAAKEDLAKVVDDSISKSKRKCLEINRNFERRTIARFHSMDETALSTGADGYRKQHHPYSRSMIFVFDSGSDVALKKAKADFFLKLRRLSESYISRNLMIAVFNISSDMIYVLCSTNEEPSPRGDDYIYSCERLERSSYPDVMISCFRKQFQSRDMNAQYSDIIELSLLRILYKDTSRHDLSRYEKDEDREQKLGICRLLNNLCQAFNQKNVTGFLNILERLREEEFFHSLLTRDLIRQNIDAYLHIHTGFEAGGSSGTPAAWLDRLREYGNSSLLSSRNSSRRYIDDVIEFVEENYMKDIGINSIAGQLKITPNYLSRLFHQETNLKFTDYIAKTRITHARRLLSETSLTIREISEKVGYRSSRHFTNLFVKFTGEYPSKYRKGRSTEE